MFGYKSSMYCLVIQKRERIEEKDTCSEDSCSILCQNNQALCWHDAEGREWLCYVLHRPVPSSWSRQEVSQFIKCLSQSLRFEALMPVWLKRQVFPASAQVASVSRAHWIRNTRELQHIPIMA